MNIIEQSRHYNKLQPSLRYGEFLAKVIDKIFAASSFYAKNLNLNNDEELLARINKADDVIDNAELILKKFKGISPDNNGVSYYQPFFATVVVGIYLYYIYENKNTPYISLMVPRQETLEIGKEMKINEEQVLKHIYEVCESALGVDGPENLKARPDTPAEIFALAKVMHDNKAVIC